MKKNGEYIWDNKKLSKALGLEIDTTFKAKRVNTDSRTITKGDIFVALKGDNFDGNKFAADAIKKGAVAAIVRNKKLKNDKFIYVDDTLKSLQKIGRYRRKHSKAKFIAITGSVGKTGTKEMIYNTLNTKYITYKTEGNLNNHIGLPLTLANMPDDIEYAVIELGMNHSGEISGLVKICQPDIAAITWVGEAHIENLGSENNIARAKAEIFEWMTTNSTAIIPADSAFHELLNGIAVKNGVSNIYSFGRKINSVTKTTGGVKATILSKKTIIPNSILDNQVLNNVLLALTVATICKIDIKKAVSALTRMKALKGRGKKIVLKNGAIIIDDSYNASPTSMKLALKNLNREQATRKIAILGDMKELGRFSRKYHEEIFDDITDIDLLITCGKDMRFLYNKARKELDAKHFDNIEDVRKFIIKELKKDDVALIKGSHGSNMYKIVDMISGK